MILYTDKIPEAPNECLFSEPEKHEPIFHRCVLTGLMCGLENPTKKCEHLGLLPDMPVHRCHCGS